MEIQLLYEIYEDPMIRLRVWEARRRAGDYLGAEAALAGRITDMVILLMMWLTHRRPPISLN